MTSRRGESANHAPSHSRGTAECLVVLLVGVLLFRAFVAEAYIVPTGSMAPTLLGLHSQLACPNCGARFALGMDEPGQAAHAACPNCGQDDLDGALASERDGDRLLVLKHLYTLRAPRRWEVVVFQNPTRPSQAYVKRVVGLPGEAVQVRDGDLYIDGRIARKSLAEARAMRLIVHDHDFAARDAARYPRWRPRGGWEPAGSGFVHRAPGPDAPGGPDWLEYRHLDPGRGGYGPVRDLTPYNGERGPGENAVADLMVEADVALGPDADRLLVRLGGGPDVIVASIPADGRGPAEVRRNGRVVARPDPLRPLRPVAAGRPGFAKFEAAWVDRRLTVALDGRPVFPPLDLDGPAPGPGRGPHGSPLALGIVGGGAEVRGLKVYRDLYYTSPPADATRPAFGVERPYQLGTDEYFVLGDNSPVSFDSRFWPESPVLPGELLVGKPFLVHLPSRGLPLEVLGRQTYWIPDPREIRYIR